MAADSACSTVRLYRHLDNIGTKPRWGGKLWMRLDAKIARSSFSVRFDSHFPGEPGLAGVY